MYRIWVVQKMAQLSVGHNFKTAAIKFHRALHDVTPTYHQFDCEFSKIAAYNCRNYRCLKILYSKINYHGHMAWHTQVSDVNIVTIMTCHID